ncbi:MAG: magnesium/cobalt transporter CorA [Flavobacteriia bacterium]|jgi:magnesium transporter
MESNQICQLYKYDHEFFMVTTNTPAHFATEFVQNAIDEDYVSWLNFHSLSERNCIEKLCSNLHIDILSVEDIYTEKRRPKLEEYPNYVFFSVRSALPSENNTFILQQEQISFILGKNYLISFQEKSSDHFPDVRDRISKKRGKIRFKGPDFLLFRMLEAITDNYFEVLEDITDSIEKLEIRLLRNASHENLKLIEFQKRKLVELRKIVLPLKEVTFQLDKIKSPFIDPENHHYFTDLKENCMAVLEEIDANKQILEGMANLYYAVQGQRMNEIMKVLTVVSSIFIPLTFIVGVYGMNFEHMPELKYPYGYYTVVGVMFLIAITLLIIFIKRGWLTKK